MIKLTVLTVLIFLASSAQAGISDVLDKAHADEADLSPEYSQKLLDAQGKFISENVPACMNETQTMPTSFTLVMNMSVAGKVKKSWSSDSKSFTQCFQDKADKLFRYIPPKSDFYTAIEFNID